MKYIQNTRGRIPYIFILFLVYKLIIKALNLSINTSMYGLFFMLILFYYIFGIFTLIENYSFKEFLISLSLNSIIFFVLLIFHKNINIVLCFFIYTGIQNLIRYILAKLYKDKIKILLLGIGYDKQRVEDAILNNLEYNYIENLDCEFGNKANLDEIIKKKKITKVIYIKEMEDQLIDQIFKLKLSRVKVLDSNIFLQNIEGKIDMTKVSKKWFLESKGFDILTSTLEKRLKRFMDISISVVIFLILLPIMILIYICIKLDNPKKFFSNPAFFKQNRIGMQGKIFKIIKFRSMKIHNPKDYSKYPVEKDERITLIGKFIRKTRFDELPQIINILKGDMSFVGPRPEWDELGREYEKKIKMYKLRYTVKPGLTGWAQVMYPYGTTLQDTKIKLEYDIYYIKHQNITMDIIILFKTLKVVIFGRGT